MGQVFINGVFNHLRQLALLASHSIYNCSLNWLYKMQLPSALSQLIGDPSELINRLGALLGNLSLALEQGLPQLKELVSGQQQAGLTALLAGIPITFLLLLGLGRRVLSLATAAISPGGALTPFIRFAVAPLTLAGSLAFAKPEIFPAQLAPTVMLLAAGGCLIVLLFSCAQLLRSAVVFLVWGGLSGLFVFQALQGNPGLSSSLSLDSNTPSYWQANSAPTIERSSQGALAVARPVMSESTFSSFLCQQDPRLCSKGLLHSTLTKLGEKI